jgi:hypothetical protein
LREKTDDVEEPAQLPTSGVIGDVHGHDRHAETGGLHSDRSSARLSRASGLDLLGVFQHAGRSFLFLVLPCLFELSVCLL